MIETEKIEEMRRLVSIAKADGKAIGFVPTMGALHEGHLSLIRRARQKCGFVAVSIFVNPTQFAPTEDFAAYPRTLKADAAKCRNEGVDVVFAPSAEQMYPVSNRTWVVVEGRLTESLCGKSRPNHFRGVSTVCMKLFNIIHPDIAFFGQKDAQQAAVIKAMVADANLPLSIEVCPIIREPSGLAMSSRNEYLSPEHRLKAAIIHKSLLRCEQMFQNGCRNAEILKDAIRDEIQTCDIIKTEYIEIVDFETFESVEAVAATTLVAVAVKIGQIRLIDNTLLTC